MTIDVAIEILSASAYQGMTTFNEKYKEAQKLGIEALKEIKAARSYSVGLIPELLPGETKD